MFTRQELRVLVFLSVGFLVGMAVWAYRSRWQPLPEIVDPAISTRGPVANGTPYADSATVMLNTATREELETLPGIGPVTAERIIEYRTEAGKISSVDELLKIRGIGEHTLDKIRPFLKLE